MIRSLIFLVFLAFVSVTFAQDAKAEAKYAPQDAVQKQLGEELLKLKVKIALGGLEVTPQELRQTADRVVEDALKRELVRELNELWVNPVPSNRAVKLVRLLDDYATVIELRGDASNKSGMETGKTGAEAKDDDVVAALITLPDGRVIDASPGFIPRPRLRFEATDGTIAPDPLKPIRRPVEKILRPELPEGEKLDAARKAVHDALRPSSTEKPVANPVLDAMKTANEGLGRSLQDLKSSLEKARRLLEDAPESHP